MKLASALTERADLQKRIAELSTRLNNNAKVQEGEQPSENPKDLLTTLFYENGSFSVFYE